MQLPQLLMLLHNPSLSIKHRSVNGLPRGLMCGYNAHLL
jgi:hypothetical protein